MKKKECLIAILIILFIVFMGCLFEKIRKVERNESCIKVVDDLKEFKDIRLWLEMCQDRESITFKLPKNDTVQDYNTYYGNLILLNLGENYVNKKIIGYIENIVAEENFMMWKNEDVFEGIEKCYYYDDLCRHINSQYHNNNIAKYVGRLVKKSYNKTGFFISEEFKERIKKMSKDDSKTIKLAQTMEMLYLCEKYNFLNKIDKEAISNWLIKSIQSSDSYIVDKYYVMKSLQYIGCFDILEDFSLKNLEYNKTNFFEILCYLNICKEYNINIHQSEKKELYNLAIEVLSDMPIDDLQRIYYATETIRLLNNNIDRNLIKEINKKISIFRYKNGLFPVISDYIIDNKQILMYYEMAEELGMTKETMQFSSLIIHDFKNMDSFDIYSYAVLCKKTGQDIDGVKQEVVKQLEKCTLDEKNKIMYLLRTLNYIGSMDKCDCMNKEIENYINIIVNHDEKDGYDILDLILLYGFIDSGMLKGNSTLIGNIKNIKINKNDELSSSVLYYKYKILLDLNYDFDKSEVYKQLSSYKCTGGYKKREADSFMDLQTTYLFLDLKASLDYD